ncbi:MAG: hypothetical protein HYU36_24925 [Planctomycetes bacterium]|nr:hypothetical protein [Planctomycetota bacterium]
MARAACAIVLGLGNQGVYFEHQHDDKNENEKILVGFRPPYDGFAVERGVSPHAGFPKETANVTLSPW